ncbi:MAG: hypothetical protein U9N19_01675 [Thermodesulfobacteriota bacterium]|nr:hypothetical protein [Thermodesulfobacteriota bacterium]
MTGSTGFLNIFYPDNPVDPVREVRLKGAKFLKNQYNEMIKLSKKHARRGFAGINQYLQVVNVCWLDFNIKIYVDLTLLFVDVSSF